MKAKVGNLCRLINEGFTNEDDGKNWLFLITKVGRSYYEAQVMFSSFDDDLLPSPLKLFIDKDGRITFNHGNKRNYDDLYYYEGDLDIIS